MYKHFFKRLFDLIIALFALGGVVAKDTREYLKKNKEL